MFINNFVQRIKQRKHLSGFILICMFHSFFLIYISLWLVNQRFVLGDERILFQLTAGVKKIVLGLEQKPDPKDYIFINSSYDNMLIDKLDDDGFQIGNEPITDRRKLGLFFERLNKRPDFYKYVVCDIFFKDSSVYDSAFTSNISNAKNLIIPYHLNDSENASLPFIKVNSGLADYHSVQYVFMKYSLIDKDTMKSLPLKMYEDITGKKLIKKSFLSFLDGKPSFSSIIVDFKLRYYELMDRNSEQMYNIVNLGELLKMNDSVFYNAVKNKIILIGDFYERDIHSTLFGKMSGTLILLNVYLALLNGENYISFGLLSVLFIGFFLVSIELFSEKRLKERKLVAKYTQKKIGKFLLKIFSYVIYMTILSIITYFIFNIHLNILIIAVYLKSIDSLLNYVRGKKKEKLIERKENEN